MIRCRCTRIRLGPKPVIEIVGACVNGAIFVPLPSAARKCTCMLYSLWFPLNSSVCKSRKSNTPEARRSSQFRCVSLKWNYRFDSMCIFVYKWYILERSIDSVMPYWLIVLNQNLYSYSYSYAWVMKISILNNKLMLNIFYLFAYIIVKSLIVSKAVSCVLVNENLTALNRCSLCNWNKPQFIYIFYIKVIRSKVWF